MSTEERDDAQQQQQQQPSRPRRVIPGIHTEQDGERRPYNQGYNRRYVNKKY